MIGTPPKEAKRLAKVALAEGEAAAITALRLSLLSNGYSPTPNRDKRAIFKGWHKGAPTEEIVRGWLHPRATVTLRPATGLLVVDGLATVDCDIPDDGIAREIREVIRTLAPQLFSNTPALERGRDDNSPKMMLFCRREPASKPFTIRSRRWSKTGSEGGPTFVVEIFASDRDTQGQARRQVGSLGAHTVDDDTGAVKINYRWPGASPVEVKLSELPVIDEATALRIADEVDRILERHGLKEVMGHRGGKITPLDVYELDDDSRFGGEDFTDIDLEGLAEEYWLNHARGLDTRCSGSFTDPHAVRTDRCHVGWSGGKLGGHLTVHDYANDCTHRPKAADPNRPLSPQFIAELDAMFAAFDKVTQTRPQQTAVSPTRTGED